jgi:hypothetical protein
MNRVHHNSVTGVDPLQVAQLFAVQNFHSQQELSITERIIDAIRHQRFSEAKVLSDEFIRPELLDGPSYYRRKQFTSFLSKVPFKGSNKMRQSTALSSFWKAEVKCRRTNRKLRHYNKYVNRLPDDIRVVLARSKGNPEGPRRSYRGEA